MVATPAHAALPRQFGSFTNTATAPGAATGLVVDLKFRNPENPSQKPYTAKTMVVHAAAGGVIDTTVPPQCHASDAQLMLQGPSACPPDTKIGSGFSISDTGGGGPLPRDSRATITNFNNQDEVIGVGVVDSLPALKPVDRTKIHGRDSTTNFPLFPGAPPPDPYTPFKQLHVVFPRYVRNGRAYMRTPPSCASVGYWTIVAEFTYVDGVKQSLESHSPCHASGRPPTKPKPKPKKRRHCTARTGRPGHRGGRGGGGGACGAHRS
jgi:hypothetical protein